MTLQGCGPIGTAAALGHMLWAVPHSGNGIWVIQAPEAAVSSKVSGSFCVQSPEWSWRREKAHGEGGLIPRRSFSQNEGGGFLPGTGRASVLRHAPSVEELWDSDDQPVVITGRVPFCSNPDEKRPTESEGQH